MVTISHEETTNREASDGSILDGSLVERLKNGPATDVSYVAYKRHGSKHADYSELVTAHDFSYALSTRAGLHILYRTRSNREGPDQVTERRLFRKPWKLELEFSTGKLLCFLVAYLLPLSKTVTRELMCSLKNNSEHQRSFTVLKQNTKFSYRAR